MTARSSSHPVQVELHRRRV